MFYWEDFAAGQVERFGAYRVTQAEITEFGKSYDPLPFHTDPAAAEDGPYGGLIAPGLLVCAMFMRMLVDHLGQRYASRGSPGVDSVRWKRPVRPGDTLSVMQEVTHTRALESRPDMGLIKTRSEVRNQHGETVCEIASNALFQRQPHQATGETP